ncbi:cell wall anchor protein [Phytohabitans kaempferiae]|uniref:Cell wall anchor protein n=1 Tax=Phytohabitans kaempferiae TaxID=1620943 RepID=A0ABV6M676_9ACTN
MNRRKLSLRRPLALVGAAALGLAAALMVASPASAHHSEVDGKAVCDTETGEWVVTWTVTSFAPQGVERYKLVKADLTPAGTTVTEIRTTEGNDYPYSVDTPVVGVQRVPGDATSASLTVKAKWKKERGAHLERDAKSKTVELGGECKKDVPSTTAPTASFSPDCEGTVNVTLGNGQEATAAVKLTVSAGEFKETFTLEPGETKTDIQVPADAGEITVSQEGKEEPVGTYTWTEPENCVAPGEPEGDIELTCDEMIFTVKNPADGETVTITLTPNTGEPQTLTVAPGETKSATFPASEGLTVTPSVEGEEGEPIAWTAPDDCEPGAGGGGPELPVTGAAAGGIAGGALALLAIGAVLFYLARRRRMTFTA